MADPIDILNNLRTQPLRSRWHNSEAGAKAFEEGYHTALDAFTFEWQNEVRTLAEGQPSVGQAPPVAPATEPAPPQEVAQPIQATPNQQSIPTPPAPTHPAPITNPGQGLRGLFKK